jgi:chemotaxis response regulator CheB
VVVDDHPVVRDALRSLLDSHDDIAVVGTAADGHQAVALVLAVSPDVALMDLEMPGGDGVEAIRALRDAEVDIGNAVRPYYGNAGGKALTKLLKTHIRTAVATVLAAKSGDTAATKKAEAAFYANGKQVASFLHKANPKFWPLAAMQTMMRVHLNQVVMPDMLSNGIIQQFPSRFH